MKRKLSMTMVILSLLPLTACSNSSFVASVGPTEAPLVITGEVIDAPMPALPAPGKGCKWVTDTHGGYYTSKSFKNMDGNYFTVPLGASSKVEQCKAAGKIRIVYKGKVGWIWNY